MRSNCVARLTVAAAFAVLAPLSSALAGKSAAPEAADQTLGVAILSAQLDAGANIIGGAGAVSARHITDGRYEVTFVRDVRTCTYTGVTGHTSGPVAGYVTAGPSDDDPRTVDVETYDNLGLPTLRAFHLIVFCAR